MMIRICVRLTLMAGLLGWAQIQAQGQATLDAARPDFGTQPAPYSQAPVARAYPAGPGGAAAGNPYIQQSSALDQGVQGAPDPTKPLARGDIVTFSIAQDRDEPQVMQVTDTGELDFSAFPKIGRISVVGRTCDDLARELKHKLEADYYNSADVRLGINKVNHAGSLATVYLSGLVRAPGPEQVLPGERMTLSAAIIKAGGFAQFANERRVQVTRKNKGGKIEHFTVDVKAIIDKGRQDLDMELQDGDYINVPQNLINF